jgi:hypothetical protein
VGVKKGYIPGGNKAIVNSNVIVFEDNPVARLLFNGYGELRGLGE